MMDGRSRARASSQRRCYISTGGGGESALPPRHSRVFSKTWIKTRTDLLQIRHVPQKPGPTDPHPSGHHTRVFAMRKIKTAVIYLDERNFLVRKESAQT
ncbi:hypothetical protein MTP99_008755 [Tenebrio molitor]|nr:hypothetical protein MTP99_008755 [Tenebrio molitor]